MAISVRPRRLAACAVLAAAASTLVVPPAAVAAPGDDGDVKIHKAGTRATDPADEPKVCKFSLAAFDFGTVRTISWTIAPQPAVSKAPAPSGTLTLKAGAGASAPVSLPDGQYKLTWTFTGGTGAAKQKVFTVDCPDDPGTPPNGGPPAGGGGLARDDAFTPVAGAAGVGLAAVGGVAWLRFRRRADGTAS
ncbi:MAG TPA: hypothetical protein VFP69_02045 [Streptomyces sp.]|nr:hypothetical protein [Streptomyces sp.]